MRAHGWWQLAPLDRTTSGRVGRGPADDRFLRGKAEVCAPLVPAAPCRPTRASLAGYLGNASFPRFPGLRAARHEYPRGDESRGFASRRPGRPCDTLGRAPPLTRTRSQSGTKQQPRSAAGRCCGSVRSTSHVRPSRDDCLHPGAVVSPGLRALLLSTPGPVARCRSTRRRRHAGDARAALTRIAVRPDPPSERVNLEVLSFAADACGVKVRALSAWTRAPPAKAMIRSILPTVAAKKRPRR